MPALYTWSADDHFKKKPSVKRILRSGKRNWDSDINYKLPFSETTNSGKAVFTMPSFGRNGRWGNVVLQYLFIRVLAFKNNRDIELFREADYINNRMLLYEDMQHIPTVQTKSDTLLVDSHQIFASVFRYIPPIMWRAFYVSEVRSLKCLVLNDPYEALNEPLPIENNTSLEIEGLFLFNVAPYKKQFKQFILSELFKPTVKFQRFIDDTIKNLGENVTVVGVHIRRGDFIHDPLDQLFQLPIATRYIIDWLKSNIPSIKNAVIYVCSNDFHCYKEIEKAGYTVFTTQKMYPEGGIPKQFDCEQFDWEILRRCDVLLMSNSTFSFSAALLNNKNATCFQFSFTKKLFIQIDPWDSDPLQLCSFSPNLLSYLSNRFALVWQMVALKPACKRVVKDVKQCVFWKKTRIRTLYYKYGLSIIFFLKIFDISELFKVSDKNLTNSSFEDFFKIQI